MNSNHLGFFYFFSTFSIGMICLAIVFVTWMRMRQKILRDFLILYSCLTIQVMASLFLAYIQINMPELERGVVVAFEYFESFISKYLVMFAIPFFTHTLFQPSQVDKRNRFFAILTLGCFFVQHITEYGGSNQLDDAGDIFERVVLGLVFIYSLQVGFTHRKNQRVHFFIARTFPILMALFLPGLLMDLFVEQFPFRFYPVLYVSTSILFSGYFLKTYFLTSQAEVSSKTPIGSVDLSSRELEVAELVLQGYSNQEIGTNLHISLSTVKTHVGNVYRKCGVNSRYELLAAFSYDQIKTNRPDSDV